MNNEAAPIVMNFGFELDKLDIQQHKCRTKIGET